MLIRTIDVLDDKIKSHPKKDGETHFSDKHKIDQDDGTKDNPIPTECLEVIAFEITDQELDGNDRNEESGKHA